MINGCGMKAIKEVSKVLEKDVRPYWKFLAVARLCMTQCYEGFSLNAVLVPASINELTPSARRFVDSE